MRRPWNVLRPAWFTVVTLGCSGPVQAVAPEDAAPHLGDEWFAFRASTLGIAVDEARARDAAFSEEEPPPEDVFDRTLAVESAVVWRGLCAACHGLHGDREGAPAMEPEPKRWDTFGVKMGFTFGGNAMRAGLYRRIRQGGASDGSPSPMPSWKDVLSREQTWGLVRHIEGF